MLMQFGTIRAKLVFSVVVSLVIFGLTENAHAVVPTLVSAEITGPNTITVVYSIPVISAQADYTNLVLTPGGARAVTGHVGTGTTTITLTFGGAIATPGTTATMDITGGVANVREFGGIDVFATVIGQAVANGQGPPSFQASSPTGGLQPPTMGITRHGLVLVEEGFSYNGNPVDVHLVNTDYPLVTTNVGEENVAKLKIYSPRGIERLQHAAIAFGLDKQQIFAESNVVIEWDRLHNGEETLTVIDPGNYLDNVRVVTSEGVCRTSANDLCLIIEFYHTFRQPLDYNIIGTYIWDDIRSGWQNFYNDGVEIIGDSLNPPAVHQVVYKGRQIQITESGKNIALDEEGNLWTFDKSWKMEYQPRVKIDDGITSQGFDRNHVKFSTYQKGQELIAKNILSSILGGKVIQNNSLVDSIFYESKYLPRSEDIELQNRIDYEIHRANSWYSGHFVITTEDEHNKYLDIYKKFYEQTS